MDVAANNGKRVTTWWNHEIENASEQQSNPRDVTSINTR